MDGGTNDLHLYYALSTSWMICQAMAAEMHSWGASAVGMYLSFAKIAFFVGIRTWN